MAKVLKDEDVQAYILDVDSAVLRLKSEDFVMDYSTLMDTIIQLASLASEMEKIQLNPGCMNLISNLSEKQLH